MSEFFAFIDESGNNALNTEKDGATKYFVLAAVICDSNSLDKLNQLASQISLDFYSGGEIKSNKTKPERRIKILKLLIENDVKFSTMAINKDEISKDSALDYKQVFIKYINKIFYSQLVVRHEPLTILADKHGGDEFSSSFLSYVEKKFRDQLFSLVSIKHVDSKQEKIIQIADLISGTVRLFYEGKNKEVNDLFLKYKKKSCLFIDEWPLRSRRSQVVKDGDFKQDFLVADLSISLAQDFKNKNLSAADEFIQMQVAVVGHLLFNAIYDANRYLKIPEIKGYLNFQGYPEIGDQQFRSNVIAKLRDSGLIIASSNDGYKIPTKYKDVIDFVEKVDGLVIPLIDRLARAIELIKSKSDGVYDPLSDDRYKKLKEIIEVIK
jgi:hypothetical protein